jgi:hypothetical protein
MTIRCVWDDPSFESRWEDVQTLDGGKRLFAVIIYNRPSVPPDTTFLAFTSQGIALAKSFQINTRGQCEMELLFAFSSPVTVLTNREELALFFVTHGMETEVF